MNYEIKIALKDVLTKNNRSRYWLAQETGLHYKTIDSYYKNSIRRYEADTLLKMCVALNCEIGELIKIIKK